MSSSSLVRLTFLVTAVCQGSDDGGLGLRDPMDGSQHGICDIISANHTVQGRLRTRESARGRRIRVPPRESAPGQNNIQRFTCLLS